MHSFALWSRFIINTIFFDIILQLLILILISILKLYWIKNFLITEQYNHARKKSFLLFYVFKIFKSDHHLICLKHILFIWNMLILILHLFQHKHTLIHHFKHVGHVEKTLFFCSRQNLSKRKVHDIVVKVFGSTLQSGKENIFNFSYLFLKGQNRLLSYILQYMQSYMEMLRKWTVDSMPIKSILYFDQECIWLFFFPIHD